MKIRKQTEKLGLVIVAFCVLLCLAARYEDFHVTLLRIGDPAIQVSGTTNSVLERLAKGQLPATNLQVTSVAVASNVTVQATNGGVSIAGTLTVTGATTLASTLSAEHLTSTDDATIVDAITIGGALTATGASTFVADVTIDSRYAVVGPDTTTGLMVQSWTNAISSGSNVHAFATDFAGIPQVFVSWDAAPTIASNSLYELKAQSTTSQVVIIGLSDVIYSGFAIGARP